MAKQIIKAAAKAAKASVASQTVGANIEPFLSEFEEYGAKAAAGASAQLDAVKRFAQLVVATNLSADDAAKAVARYRTKAPMSDGSATSLTSQFKAAANPAALAMFDKAVDAAKAFFATKDRAKTSKSVFQAVYALNVMAKDAAANGKPLTEYSPKAVAAKIIGKTGSRGGKKTGKGGAAAKTDWVAAVQTAAADVDWKAMLREAANHVLPTVTGRSAADKEMRSLIAELIALIPAAPAADTPTK